MSCMTYSDLDDDDFEEVDQLSEFVDAGLSISSSQKCSPKSLPYEILELSQIAEVMDKIINEVNQVVELNPTIVRLLLDYFHWNTEKFLEQFCDSNRDELFGKAKAPRDMLLSFDLQTAKEGSCGICLAENIELVEYGCSHAYCYDCWKHYVSDKITEDAKSNIICAAPDCNILFEDGAVLPLIDDDATRIRYEQNRSYGFVSSNKTMRWCPGPDCGYVVRFEDETSLPVECRCDTVFCFKCGESWHAPIDCELLIDWMRKFDGESETLMYLVEHTKKCPGCTSNIEKDGGCDHMTCRKCGHEFCWVCLGVWPHSHCNDIEKANRTSTGELVKRFNFYSERYVNQKGNLNLEAKLAKGILVEDSLKANLKLAFNTLRRCREALMYTYVFAFYHERNNQLEIFLENQRKLEDATEALSEHLERKLILKEDRSLVEKYQYCEVWRKNLIGHVQEGYDNDWWTLFKV